LTEYLVDRKVKRPRYGLFFGCMIENKYPGFESSFRSVLEKLGVGEEFGELPGTSCCPVPGVFYSCDKESWLCLAARNLCIAQDRKAEIVTFCNGCFSSLLTATEYLSEPRTMGVTNRVLKNINKKYVGILTETPEGRKVFNPVTVRNFVEVLHNDLGPDFIRERVKNPLNGLRVAVHYGCHYLRPTEKTTIEDPIDPKMLDALVEALGAESVDYADKLDCCGAGGGIRSHVIELADAISLDKYKNIDRSGADCIVTPCPFCLLQLDRVQVNIEGRKIPVFHLSQIMALALGVEMERLGLEMHRVRPDDIIAKYGVRE